MKVTEVRKLKIDLTKEEVVKIGDALDILNGVAEKLDEYGFYDEELEDKLEPAVDGLEFLLSLEEKEFNQQNVD